MKTLRFLFTALAIFLVAGCGKAPVSDLSDPQVASAAALAEALAAPAASPEEKAAKITRVMALYESAGVAPAALSAISELTERAVSRGCEADISDSARDSLRSFAYSLVGRVK